MIKGTDTECVNGHKRTPENTRKRPDGVLVCRQCNAEGGRKFRQRERKRDLERWQHGPIYEGPMPI